VGHHAAAGIGRDHRAGNGRAVAYRAAIERGENGAARAFRRRKPESLRRD
jgi:hypothetical protein